MDTLTAFGLFSVCLCLLFYAIEGFGRWTLIGFAVACMMSSVYGFLQGAWPFGLVEIVWTLVSLNRWRNWRPGQPV